MTSVGVLCFHVSFLASATEAFPIIGACLWTASRTQAGHDAGVWRLQVFPANVRRAVAKALDLFGSASRQRRVTLLQCAGVDFSR